ncbi:MAG: anion permease, partial [Cellulosilyticaceae bacterium]
SLVGALLFFVAWVLSPSVIPAGPAQQFVKDTQNIIPVFIIAICCFVRLEKKPLVDFRGIVSKYMLWPVILIVASALTIGNALTAESTGITELLKQMVTPLFEGQSPIMFMILIITLACILTNVCNNMVVGMLLVPIIHVFSQEMGINPIPVAILSLFLVCVAIVTPAASTTSAILHGNTKWISTKEAYKYGIIMTIVTLLITLMIGLPLANIIF